MSTKTTFADKRTEAREAVEKMHARIAEQVVTGSDWMTYLKFASKFHRYSPNNVMLMWMQWEERKIARQIVRALEAMFYGSPITEPLPDLSHTAGFSAWADMGGNVKKGEKALSVLAPFVITDKENLDPVTGKPMKRVIGFVLKNRTFDISQTEGIERPPAPAALLEGEGPEGLWDALVRLANAEGFSVTVEPVPGSANGFCNYTTKSIVVEEANDPAQQVKTLAHEVGHMLMHAPDALSLAFGFGFGGSNAIREVEAESVAFTVMSLCGFDSADYSLGYVGSWAKGDTALIAATLERVANTAARIQTFIETGVLPDEKVSKFYADKAKAEATEEAA